MFWTKLIIKDEHYPFDADEGQNYFFDDYWHENEDDYHGDGDEGEKT